jgi:hypothetical protein
MNGIEYALRRIHGCENELAKDFLQFSQQHHDDHEAHHVSRDLAAWSREHVRILAEHAGRHGLKLTADADSPSTVAGTLREALSSAVGRRPEPGLLLLEDLNRLYLKASEGSLAWEMLAQIAQAEHDADLLQATQECHPQNLRQIRWTNTMIKTQSPQILAAM